MVTTDMPNIIIIKEQSNLAQWRMIPEQMLYACPSLKKETRHHDSTFFFRSSFNEFNQYMVDEVDIPTILPPATHHNHHHHHHQEDRPSLLSSEVHERWTTSIRTADLMLPTNLLSHRLNTNRIYGFYYLMA